MSVISLKTLQREKESVPGAGGASTPAGRGHAAPRRGRENREREVAGSAPRNPDRGTPTAEPGPRNPDRAAGSPAQPASRSCAWGGPRWAPGRRRAARHAPRRAGCCPHAGLAVAPGRWSVDPNARRSWGAGSSPTSPALLAKRCPVLGRAPSGF